MPAEGYEVHNMGKNSWKWIFLLGFLPMAVLLLVGIRYISSTNDSLWNHSISDVLEVSKQGAGAMEAYFEQGFTVLESRKEQFAEYASDDTEGILGILKPYHETKDAFAVIDVDHGMIYFQNAEPQELPQKEKELYQNLREKGILEPYISELTGHPMIGYYECFTFADGARGLVRSGLPLSEVADKFSISFYNNTGFSYVVNAKGDILLRPNHRNSNHTFLNIFDVVELDDNSAEDTKIFRQGMTNGNSGAMRLNMNGEAYVFAFVPLKDTEDWYLVSIIPNDMIMREANQILQTSRIFLAVIIVVILIYGLFAFVVITYRRKIDAGEAELKYREQLFGLLAKDTNDVFLMLDDRSYKAEYVSPNIERVLGILPEQVLEEISSFVRQGENPLDMRDWIDKVPLGETTSREIERTHKRTGEKRWFLETVYHTVIDNVGRFILTLSDRTDERKKEAALTEALDIARIANQSKSDFLSGMSHDMRTPMNAIAGLCVLLRRDAKDEGKVLEYTQKISTSSKHLLALINDVLDMSKIESGKTTLNISPFSLKELVDGLVTIIRPQTEAKHQQFHVIFTEVKDDYILGDKLRISQILMNILSNAVKYTPKKGKVELIVCQPEAKFPNTARIRFVVRDNGIGMSPEYQRKIFEAYTRDGSQTVNQTQGTGLGMAIAKGLVDLMGGIIDLESEVGKGSVFTVELSLPVVDVRDHQETTEYRDDEGEESNVLKGRHFLAVDDNELNIEILSELLDMEGATCDLAYNGKEAVEIFESSPQGKYDAILMDVQMPVMNGYEATRAIRSSSHPEAESILIIAMTANAFAEDVRDAMDAGMNIHIAKPVDMEYLNKELGRIWQ